MNQGNTMNIAEMPVIIETAITPLRKGEPVQSTEAMISEGKASLAAGAGIVHHHHNFQLPADEAIQQIITVQKAILDEYPSTVIYTDYLRADSVEKKMAHLMPMREAGVLRMFAFDPGLTVFARTDAHGLPSSSISGGTTYSEADYLVGFANNIGVPISLGVFEPGNLRWIKPYALAGKFPQGTMIKLYFGGEYLMGGHKERGATFGLPPTKAALDMYLSMIEGTGMPWVVSVLGNAILDTPLARYALERGGHLRVGVEDPCGDTQLTNAELVTEALALAAQVGRPVAAGRQVMATLTGKSSAAPA